ncbi:MAG: transposase [Terriglobales bacterium]
MLLFTATFGGLLLMMGHHSREEALFYYFRLEDQVPENHLLRLIDRHVSLEFIRAKLKDCYSDAGRPSIDPELLLRMLLIGYLYGVTSERKLVEELRMHLAWRWFTGLGFDQEKKRAVIATARKLAVLLHRLWVSTEAYEPLRNSNQRALPAAA